MFRSAWVVLLLSRHRYYNQSSFLLWVSQAPGAEDPANSHSFQGGHATSGVHPAFVFWGRCCCTAESDRMQNGISFGLSAFESERSLPQLNVESRVTVLGGLEFNLVSLCRPWVM